MKVYLLDTNVISAWLDSDHPKCEDIRAVFEAADIGEDRVAICPVTLAEVEYGYHVCLAPDEERRRRLMASMNGLFIFDVDKHVVPAYAEVRSTLFQLYARNGKGRKRFREKIPEQLKMAPAGLIQQTNALELGIEENDLWIVAVAITHGCTFVTHEKMDVLRDVVVERMGAPIEWIRIEL